MSYPTDLNDAQWNFIQPIVDIPNTFGRPRTVNMRHIVNALLYTDKTGCQWPMLPNDFPPKSTVHYYFSKFRDDGTFIEVNRISQEQSRIYMGREKEPTAAVIDAQTSPSNFICEDIGYDGNKKITGRKRSIGVDVRGHLLACKVHSAKLSDSAGAKLLLSLLACWFMNIVIIFADGGYAGNSLSKWVMTMFFWILKIVKRPRKKFQVVKFRWVVERTFAWLINYRRLARSNERYATSEEAWIYLCAAHLSLRRVFK